MRRLALLLLLLAPPATAPSAFTPPPPTPVQPAAATRPDPAFRLLNRDPVAVHEIHVVPAGSRDWGADRLGTFVLISGRAASIALPAGQCLNDIRLVFADGRAVERRQVDTCALAQMAFP